MTKKNHCFKENKTNNFIVMYFSIDRTVAFRLKLVTEYIEVSKK